MQVLRIYYNLTSNAGTINIDVRDLGQDGQTGVTTLSRVITELPFWLQQMADGSPTLPIIAYRTDQGASQLLYFTTNVLEDTAVFFVNVNTLLATELEELGVVRPLHTTVYVNTCLIIAQRTEANGANVIFDPWTIKLAKNSAVFTDDWLANFNGAGVPVVSAIEHPDDPAFWLVTVTGVLVSPSFHQAFVDFLIQF